MRGARREDGVLPEDEAGEHGDADPSGPSGDPSLSIKRDQVVFFGL